MEAGSIITIVVFALIFICGLTFCFMQAGKGGKWED
jgi:cbb3-type cytochrome oxidase subunit 3